MICREKRGIYIPLRFNLTNAVFQNKEISLVGVIPHTASVEVSDLIGILVSNDNVGRNVYSNVLLTLETFLVRFICNVVVGHYSDSCRMRFRSFWNRLLQCRVLRTQRACH